MYVLQTFMNLFPLLLTVFPYSHWLKSHLLNGMKIKNGKSGLLVNPELLNDIDERGTSEFGYRLDLMALDS